MNFNPNQNQTTAPAISIQGLGDLQRNQETARDAGAEALGSIIYWDIYSSRISGDYLEHYAQMVGYPAKYLPSRITPTSAFKEAIRRCKAGIAKQNLRFVQLTNENETGANKQRGIVSYFLLQDDINKAAERADSKQLDIIRFDARQEFIYSDCGHEMKDRVEGLYPECLLHGIDDIRLVLTNMVNEVGIPLRQKGGVYFIPVQHEQLVDQAIALMTLINPQNTVYKLEQFATPTNVASLQQNAQSDLTSELEQLRKDIQEVLADTNAKDKTLERRLTEAAHLKARFELFAGALGLSIGELQTHLTSLENDIRGRLGMPPVPVESLVPPSFQSAPVAEPEPANVVPMPAISLPKTAVGF